MKKLLIELVVAFGLIATCFAQGVCVPKTCLQKGASYANVIEEKGKPSGVMTINGNKTLIYKDAKISFIDDKVERIEWISKRDQAQAANIPEKLPRNKIKLFNEGIDERNAELRMLAQETSGLTTRRETINVEIRKVYERIELYDVQIAHAKRNPQSYYREDSNYRYYGKKAQDTSAFETKRAALYDKVSGLNRNVSKINVRLTEIADREKMLKNTIKTYRAFISMNEAEEAEKRKEMNRSAKSISPQ